MSSLLITGGRVVDPANAFDSIADVLLRDGKVADFRYRLLPVFANMLPADAEMDALISRVRAPYEAMLGEKLAVNEGLLYRRGNFNGSGATCVRARAGPENSAPAWCAPAAGAWNRWRTVGGCSA